jgi:hypothetical protein
MWKNVPGGLPTLVDASHFPGNVFFVDVNATNAGATAGFGYHPDSALTSILLAQSFCTANQGDVVFILPGHTETVAAATEVALSKAGVTYIGLGSGTSRPTLTLSATGSNIPISAANIALKNILITTTGTINVTAGITVTGTDCLLEDIEIRESAADSQVVDGIVAAATSDRLHINGYIFRGFLTGDADASAVSVTGAVDGVMIENFDLDGLFVAAGIENVTGVATNMRIRDGFIRQRHATTDAAITLVATTTGTVERVNVRTATNDANGFNNALVGAAAQFFVCWVVNANGESGGVFGTPSAAA